VLVANVLTALQALDICVSYEVCVYPRCVCVCVCVSGARSLNSSLNPGNCVCERSSGYSSRDAEG
jgi:hypothetical protein